MPANKEDWIPLCDPIPPSKIFVETQLPKQKKSSTLSSVIPVRNEYGNPSNDSDFVNRPPPKGMLKRKNVAWGLITLFRNKRQLLSTPSTKENLVTNQPQLRSTPKKVAAAPHAENWSQVVSENERCLFDDLVVRWDTNGLDEMEKEKNGKKPGNENEQEHKVDGNEETTSSVSYHGDKKGS